ncbi:hypothetical protein F030043B2_36390 [Bacteroides fragilis]|jgi:hypothetical protein
MSQNHKKKNEEVAKKGVKREDNNTNRARLEIKIPSLQKNPISLYSKYEL